MATTSPMGDVYRYGAAREHFQTPSGHWVMRNANAGNFMGVTTMCAKKSKGK